MTASFKPNYAFIILQYCLYRLDRLEILDVPPWAKQLLVVRVKELNTAQNSIVRMPHQDSANLALSNFELIQSFACLYVSNVAWLEQKVELIRCRRIKNSNQVIIVVERCLDWKVNILIFRLLLSLCVPVCQWRPFLIYLFDCPCKEVANQLD